MSDRITWGICPTCGSRAAIGWATVALGDDAPTSERPIEVTCSAGCQATEHNQLLALQE
jgi:hypothetical protein